jgi:hypothetical protein
MRTAEQIAEIAEKKSDTYLGQIRIINRLFRRQDDSDKWPINGRFSVTERAICRARPCGPFDSALAYALAIEQEEIAIVNNENNW